MKNILIDLIKDIAFFIINGWRKFIYLICSCFKIDNKKVFVNYFDGLDSWRGRLREEVAEEEVNNVRCIPRKELDSVRE